MKIEGFEPGVPYRTLLLTWPGRGVSLEIELRGLPIGVDDRVRERIPLPAPPSRGVAIDPKTRKPLRDAASGKVMPVVDLYNGGYQAAYRKAVARRMILLVVESLSGQSKLTFDAPRPADDAPARAWEAYADAVEAEFAAGGFTDGHVMQIMQTVMRLTNVTPEELGDAREAFLSEAPEAESLGASQSTADEA